MKDVKPVLRFTTIDFGGVMQCNLSMVGNRHLTNGYNY